MGISSEDGSQASPSKGKGEANKKVSIAAYLVSSFKGRGSGHGRPLLANHNVFKIANCSDWYTMLLISYEVQKYKIVLTIQETQNLRK